MKKCGISDYIVSTELFKIYDDSGRKDLEFLRDRAANIFLQSVWRIKSFTKDANKIKRTLPIKNAYYIKTKIKAALYFISPKLYLSIHNFFKK